MAKTSKMTANRLTVSRTLHSSVATHGDEIAEALTLALFPKGAPAKLTVAGVLGAIGGLLERVDGKVAAADLAHVAELSDDDAVRVARDGSEQALRQKLLRQRDLILGTYGPAVAHAYGLDETMPVTPQQLLLLASKVEKLLRTRALTEKALQQGVTVQPKLLADDLAASAAALQTALDATKREEREAQLTLEAKNRAAEAWQQTYQGVGSALYGLYLLAGRKDLAERVMPTARRRSGLLEDADGDQPGPTPPVPPAPAPAPDKG